MATEELNSDERPRILVCDDEPLNRDLLCRTLGSGYQLAQAADGAEALGLCTQQSFDAVLLDILMPEMDGFQVCERIRRDMGDNITPIIMLTSLDDPHNVARGLEMGATDFITKPFNRIELRARIKASIEHKRAKEALQDARLRLEQRVAERTAELERTNRTLEREIAARQQKEQELIEFQEQLADLVVEKTRDLVDARDEALSAERAMSGFLTNMTHELRTPLHSILSFARFGMDKAHKAPPEQLADYFAEITTSAGNLLRLVNQLLDLSKLKAGRMQYDYQEADLQSVVRSVDNELKALKEEQDIVVCIDQEGHGDLVARMDRDKVAQVIRNLLSNALKFSPRGSTIDVTVERRPTGCLVVSVCDEGVGIPADELESIFDNFAQSTKTRNKAGGTGLGLAICREIVEAGHNGRIWAVNRESGGACFQVALPVDPRHSLPEGDFGPITPTPA